MTYAEKVNMLLMRYYGVTLDDCIDLAELAECEATSQQPFEVVNRIAEKSDFSRIDTTPFLSSDHPLDATYQYYGEGKERTIEAVSVQARSAEIIMTAAQLEDLLSYIVCNGNRCNHFEPSELPAGAQGMLYRCEESESWVMVWIAGGWPVAVNDVFNFDGFLMAS
ncbi:hypothetical protein [Cedecea davisae]|uniref:hypothetical protein n=1 Tax=Cedecea davisae TaxID=158484 RepID=UPI00243030AE|nr:hypothetical protein [Cedecea davisae]